MGKIVEQLRDYFKNTPQEKLDKDFEDLQEWNDVGQSVEDFLKYLEHGK